MTTRRRNTSPPTTDAAATTARRLSSRSGPKSASATTENPVNEGGGRGIAQTAAIEAATQLTGYRLMWIFVMFDLPVDTKAHSRAATKFREFLLDEGFERSQFSVYARFCNGKEQVEAYQRRIEAHLPSQGEVHILAFTDRQYENIVRFSGQRRRRPRKNPDQLALF